MTTRILVLVCAAFGLALPAIAQSYDVVIRGGRVMDPESGLDAVRNVGVRDGSIAACNVKIASFALAGAVNWIGTWYRPEGELKAEDIATQFAELLTQGLRGNGAKAVVGKRARAVKN